MSRFLRFALIPLLSTCLASGADGGLEERFLEKHKNLQTLQADFRQTISSPGMRQPVVSEGRFYYEAPDKLRIDYSRPAGDYFLLSGNRFETRRRGKPAAVFDADHPSARALASLRQVFRGIPPAGDFQKSIQRDGGEFRIVLTPLVVSPSLPKRIESRVDAKSLSLMGMTITMPQGAAMEFVFENPRRNQPLDSGVFAISIDPQTREKDSPPHTTNHTP